MRKWMLGLLAAVGVAVMAGFLTSLIDAGAPAALIGAFWGTLAFFVGAAGSEPYTGGPTPIELGVRY